MKKVRKMTALVLVALMMLMIAGCGNSNNNTGSGNNAGSTSNTTADSNTSASTEQNSNKQNSDEIIEVTFSVMNTTNEVPGWTAMAEAANKKLEAEGSNVRIKVVKEAAADWPEYYQKIVTQMAAGKAPDIARIANSFMPMVVNKGQAVDITSYVESELDLSQYFAESMKGANYVDGKYYGLPSGIYYMLTYYNKNLFDEAGLPYPSGDWNNAITFEQTRDYARQLSKGEGANRQFGLSAGPYMAFIGMYSVSNNGPNVFYDNGDCALDGPEAKGVYKWFDDMLNKDYSMPRPNDTMIMGAWDMFKAGRIGMVVDGTWYLGDVKAGFDGFDVGIAANPSGHGKAYASMFVDNFFICKGTKNEAAAWEALKAMYSKEGWQALAETSVGGLPIHREVLDANINELLGNKVTADDVKAFVDGLDHVLGVPYNDYYEQADQKINSVMDEWLLNKITSDEFADQAAKYVREEAAKVQ